MKLIPVRNDLIFDVGMNIGDDTSYYLARGFRVVAIDADPRMIEIVKSTFPKEVKSGRLSLLNFAVSDKDNEDVEFYLSENPRLSSLIKSVTSLGGACNVGVVRVKTANLCSLMREYGLPYYCKIDVQGYELIVLQTLRELRNPPRFLSVESECISETVESETATEEQALRILENLRKLGYQKFKLVDGATLTVLKPDAKFYSLYKPTLSPGDLWLRKMHLRLKPRTGFYGSSNLGTVSRIREQWRLNLHRKLLSLRLRYDFPYGSSGPFGDDLESEWLGYEKAKETFLYHRREYFDMISAGSKFPSRGFGWWTDWHSKLS